MIATIWLILVAQTAALVYLFWRQLRFERGVRAFAATINPVPFAKIGKFAAVGVLALFIVSKLLGGNKNA